MIGQNRERWLELCEQVAVEQVLWMALFRNNLVWILFVMRLRPIDAYREPGTPFLTFFSALTLFRKANLPKPFPPRLYGKLRAPGALDL